MNRLLTCVLLVAALTAPARAQPPPPPSSAPAAEAMAAARDLAALMNGDTVGQMSAALTAQIWPNIERQLGPKVDAATLAELRVEFEHALSSFTDEVMRDSPAVYARHFTAEELRATIGGRAPLRFDDEAVVEVAPRMQTFQADLHAKMEATLKKHGYGQ